MLWFLITHFVHLLARQSSMFPPKDISLSGLEDWDFTPATLREARATMPPLCAENAFLRGTDYASIDMFNYDYGPTKMAWLDKEVACQIGLCRP